MLFKLFHVVYLEDPDYRGRMLQLAIVTCTSISPHTTWVGSACSFYE